MALAFAKHLRSTLVDHCPMVFMLYSSIKSEKGHQNMNHDDSTQKCVQQSRLSAKQCHLWMDSFISRTHLLSFKIVTKFIICYISQPDRRVHGNYSTKIMLIHAKKRKKKVECNLKLSESLDSAGKCLKLFGNLFNS